jgi:excisionase family DNA binding protein
MKQIDEILPDRERPSPELFDIPGAASYLATSTRHLRRLASEHRIPFHKIGKFVRFARADLDDFIAAGRIEGQS